MKGNRLYVITDELRVKPGLKPASTGTSTSIFSGSSGCIQADTAVHQPTQVKRHCMSFGGRVLAGDALEMVHNHVSYMSIDYIVAYQRHKVQA
jgi:hypothetical protein